MAKCYCADCAYSSYDAKTGEYYCGINKKYYSGSDSRDCYAYNEK